MVRPATDDVALHSVSRRGLREDEKRWRTGLPSACEPWWPTWPIRGLSANENARALISMVARSTRSNQRPDTLMQDRRADRSTKPSCDARPDHTCGPIAVINSLSSTWEVGVIFPERYQ